jgi:peptidoglycan/LPS O-acetylase OafA/YrhL
MENQNILRIVLSLAIIAAFFLPLYNETVFGTALSAWQVLTGGLKDVSSASNLPASQVALMICLLVVLVCIIVILLFSLLRKPTPVLLNLLPLLAIIALIVFSMTQAKEDENVGQTLQAFGTGFYIMFLSSFLLPFTSITVTTPTNS